MNTQNPYGSDPSQQSGQPMWEQPPADPYGQPASQDPYGQPQQSPYAQAAEAVNPYAQTAYSEPGTINPYAQPQQNPYAQQQMAPALFQSAQHLQNPSFLNVAYNSEMQGAQDSSERTLAVLSWLLQFVGLGLAPIIFYAINSSPFVRHHAKQGINGMINLVIWAVGLVILMIPTFGLAVLGFVIPAILNLIWIIQGAVAAGRGELYSKPPMMWRILK